MKRQFVKVTENGSWCLVLDKPNLTEKEGTFLANCFQYGVLGGNPIAIRTGKSFFGDDFGKPMTKPLIDYNENVEKYGTIQINCKGGWCHYDSSDAIESKMDTVENVFGQ